MPVYESTNKDTNIVHGGSKQFQVNSGMHREWIYTKLFAMSTDPCQTASQCSTFFSAR